MEIVTRYQCSYCKKLFTTILQCKEHERWEHECLKCKYSKIVGQYSDEIECTRKKCIHGDI
jgi:hypothetical protein